MLNKYESNDLDEDELNFAEESFPSARFVISLYTIGAVLSLLMAFDPHFDSLQTTNCLVISWLLALGALGMNIFNEKNDQSADQSQNELD